MIHRDRPQQEHSDQYANPSATPDHLPQKIDAKEKQRSLKKHLLQLFQGSRRQLVLKVVALVALVGWAVRRNEMLNPPPRPRPLSLQGSSFVFPTVQERIEYYMDRWYDPRPGSLAVDLCANVSFYQKGASIPDGPAIFDKALLQSISDIYAYDALQYTFPHAPRRDYKMMMWFGDICSSNYSVPVMTKTRRARRAMTREQIPTIIGYLTVKRHFGQVDLIRSEVPWEKKKNTLIFRGVTTGDRFPIVKMFSSFDINDIDVGFTHLNSRYRGDKEAESLLREKQTPSQMLRYKYMLVLEGNDVSTGLKWMLYSDSVVFMPRPTCVSWAMEDKLVPFEHYIPLKDDASDLEVKLEWARNHDKECQRISQQATKYMEDLYASEQAKKDNELVIQGIVQRYDQLYGALLDKCPKIVKSR